MDLLRTEANKEQVIAAIAQWAAADPDLFQIEIIKRLAHFVDVVSQYMRTEPVNLIAPVAKSLLLLCDKCPFVTAELSQTALVRVVIAGLLEREDIEAAPELKVAFGSLIVGLYEAAAAPKKMVARFKMLGVARRLAADDSTSVKGLENS
jgi:hypothetical protein